MSSLPVLADSPNLGLAFVPSNSLQPSVPVNLSLQDLDALVRPGGIVQSRSVTAPPATVLADAGKRWIVAPAATGAWAGLDGQIALCTGAGLWRYYVPTAGWQAYDLAAGVDVLFDGSAWNESAGGGVPVPNASLPVAALAIASGAVNIDLSLGRHFTLTLTENVTGISFSNLPAAGFAGEIAVRIVQDATGGRTVALPASFKATGGSDTTFASAAGAVTLLTAMTFNQGASWAYAMQDVAA